MSLTRSLLAAAPSQHSASHDPSTTDHNGLYTTAQPVLIPSAATSYINSTLAMAYTPASAASKASTAASSPQDAFSMSHYQRSVDRAAPISLPPSALSEYPSSSPAVSSSYSSMTEAFGMSKGTGLIRRLSRGAHNRLRRRPSTTQTNRIRDQSAGPVLVRRRSDSTGQSDLAGDMSDLDLGRTSEDGNEDLVTEYPPPPPPPDTSNNLGGLASRKTSAATIEGGVAPTISSVLEQGTWLTKVTKKKRKVLKFRLDPLAAKVCWNPSNPSKQFYIDDVRDIRVGAEAKSSRQDIQIPHDQERCWITIVYDAYERSKGSSIKTMHLIAPNDYIVKLWTDALNVVSRERIEIMNALSANPDKSERSMRMAWKQATSRKNPDAEPKIDFEDAKWICRKLEINCSLNNVRAHFNHADHDLVGELNYSQYQYFVNLFKIRKDVQSLYYGIKRSDEPELSQEAFLDFLRKEQRIDVEKDRASWESKFELYCRSASGKATDRQAPPTMNLQAFQTFLSSGSNGATASIKSDPTLDRPLNEYFISSSHNTYLMGRQVAGLSSVEGYISALVKGCRCIEIDCWDGKNGLPIVNHGRTLTTEVMFEDCIAVISRYAFASSVYPLIISLEVHCNPDQQLHMVNIMKLYFGDTLLTTPLVENASVLPSPEELKNKILIKVKAASQQYGTQEFADSASARRQRSFSSPFSRAADNSIPPSPLQNAVNGDGLASRPSNTWPVLRGSSSAQSTAPSTSSSSEDSDSTPASVESKKKNSSNSSKKTSNIVPALGALGVYACGIKYSDFSAQEAKTYNHIYSFAENTFDRISRDPEVKSQLEKHNSRYLMRVYPAAIRIDSSNFNPLQSWKRGVQMAALNWQTYDIHLQMNEAMFAAGTDRTGYVLKPEEMRYNKQSQTSGSLLDGLRFLKRGKHLVQFSVDIVSAQRLPRPRNHNPELGMNPYVEFEVYAAEDNKSRGYAKVDGGIDIQPSGMGPSVKRRTRLIEGNGFDPNFGDCFRVSLETKYPSLVFVRCTVWNSPDGRNASSNSTLLATFTAKLTSLQQGYRHLPLFNSYGERYRDAKLFVRIKKDSPIALSSAELDSKDEPLPTVSDPRAESSRQGSRSWSRKIFQPNDDADHNGLNGKDLLAGLPALNDE
ncbi:PLC-like phosphodiesterase [Aureobasidium subglaciale]|nr:PLC-like phosphodiesterase [Aureobasidium subglaciale]KAI5222611.1 PLC-like phosphodiesterase [Aureobasidium subglaciale]KAI5233154.1 PLC-like phosphodiesterase [Aureobasidium subglaciale]KAI5262291.1 PLC-like phosphodiesterase [Aureobasidium subglaciale]